VDALQCLSVHQFSCFALVGDFNINILDTQGGAFLKLQELLQYFSLFQVIHSPTHYSNQGTAAIIDLALISEKKYISDFSTCPPLANSDHNGLELTLNISFTKKSKQASGKVWRYDKMNVERARRMISETDWNALVDESNVSDSVQCWTNQFLHIMSLHKIIDRLFPG